MKSKLLAFIPLVLAAGLLSSCVTTIHSEPLPERRKVIVHKKKVTKSYHRRPHSRRVIVVR